MKQILKSDCTPARPCELCLQPMKFLGDHTECRLFTCDDCALVSTESLELALHRSGGFATKPPSL